MLLLLVKPLFDYTSLKQAESCHTEGAPDAGRWMETTCKTAIPAIELIENEDTWQLILMEKPK